MDQRINFLNNQRINYKFYVKDGELNIIFSYPHSLNHWDSWVGGFARLLQFLAVTHKVNIRIKLTNVSLITNDQSLITNLQNGYFYSQISLIKHYTSKEYVWNSSKYTLN